jgi:hypothetical protein
VITLATYSSESTPSPDRPLSIAGSRPALIDSPWLHQRCLPVPESETRQTHRLGLVLSRPDFTRSFREQQVAFYYERQSQPTPSLSTLPFRTQLSQSSPDILQSAQGTTQDVSEKQFCLQKLSRQLRLQEVKQSLKLWSSKCKQNLWHPTVNAIGSRISKLKHKHRQ